MVWEGVSRPAHFQPSTPPLIPQRQTRQMPGQMQRFDARKCSSEDVIRAIKEDGCCIVEHLITAEAADALVAEMQPYIDRTTKGNDNFAGLNTTRTGALAARSPTFNKHVLLNKIFLDTADELLLPWCKRYTVMATQVIRIGPNSPAQPWHRDRQAWLVPNLTTGRLRRLNRLAISRGKDMLTEIVEPQLASVWALSDFTKENGATMAAPKTHIRPLNYDYIPTEEETCYAEMPKGTLDRSMNKYYAS